jgi:O-antigen biosynthesis protein
MKFTGERFIPTELGRIRLEHYHRYAMVLGLAKDKTVLDVACGEGYGSFLMADVAATVVGLDISEEVICHASSLYDRPNLNFLQGSATKIEFPDNSFDLVISFETIEHLAEQEQMLAEIRRVLHPDGVFIISSPNRPIYSEESGEHNEFHVKELDFQEFDSLLRLNFQVIQYFGQRLLMSSVIQPLNVASTLSSVWSDTGAELNAHAGSMKDPVYFVAICGATNVSLPNLGMSALYPDSLDLVKHYIGFAKWAQSLDLNVSELEAQITNLTSALQEVRTIASEREAQITNLTSAPQELRTIASEREAQITKLSSAIQELEAKQLALIMSYSWRITEPLREARRWVSSPKDQAKRYTRGVLRLAKQIYQRLPLSFQTKARHRQLIAKLAPKILLASGAHSSMIPSLSMPLQLIKPSINPEVSNVSRADRAVRIEIPAADNPLISIIIPVYGKIDYTLHCLASIAAYPPQTLFEVIVIDDCSLDDSWNVLSMVRGIHLLHNKENQGFIRSCNLGANTAKGEYLHFLNNDTEVTSGWLDELLRTFDEFPGTGLAGSKLVYPDGRLQEAGGIVWQDGSAWNFGRFQDPQLPIYNYTREVDYCSGASILVPKKLFNELVGFDELYLPAYCEDSDLALKIRDKGYRVIYQPMSTVIHFEGITSGTDTAQGVKAYQVENSKKFFTRWQQSLMNHQIPGVNVDRAKDRRATRRVLVLDHCTPMPNKDAGSVTVFNLLLLLREMDFQVTFIPEDNFLYLSEYTTNLERAGIEVLYAPYLTSVKQHLTTCGDRYDLALLFRPMVVERNLTLVRKYCPNAKVLYHTVDLHFLRMSREAELKSDNVKKKMAAKMKEFELEAIRRVDASIVHSTVESELIRGLLPEAKIYVFPLIMDVQRASKAFQERRDIVFVGGYDHSPNIDAVKYFAEEVMPLLRKKLSGVRFYVVGSNPTKEIKELASEDIIITGFVEDLKTLLNKMRVSVAPLRYGAGIKGKIGVAMAVGLPVVATSLAAEGMSLTDDENLLVADGAGALADALARIYQDEVLWSRISQNSLTFAEQAWGAEAAWGILASILADIGMKVKRSKYSLSLYSELSVRPAQRKLLQAVGSAKDRTEFIQLLANGALKQSDDMAQQLLAHANAEAFAVDGFCVPCDKKVSFLVDMQSGGQTNENGWMPNWRERLECPQCRMNNRQRLIATLLNQALSEKQEQQVYLMEQVTPIFNWATTTFRQHQITGSEYLGYEYPSGTVIKGIRHEDIENLSFADNQLDLIVSNDVFEHVPNPAKAFAECARVLKSGGVMLATIPFHSDKDTSVIRAKLNNNQLEHFLPPAFHGNPVSADGSLVFTDFGWDLLTTMKDAGFSDAAVDVYVSAELGHFGSGQLVFRAGK